jgi:hypothetical protein
VNWGRGWLSLASLLATLLAQGVHDHDHDRKADAAFVESMGDSDDTRPHLGDHEVDGRLAGPIDCPSCQFQGQHSLAEIAPRPWPGPSLAIPPATDSPSTQPGSPLRTRCRAPPRD